LRQHTKPISKRQQIWELVEEGKFSPTQIAFQVGTTVRNVWKETSNFRKNAGITISGTRTIERKTKQKDEVMIVKASQEFRDAREADIIGYKPNPSADGTDHYNQDLAIPVMDAKGLKVLYKGFKSQKKPVDIIARCGFHPHVVVTEYRRFMQLTETDIHELLRQIIIRIGDTSGYYQTEIKVIVDTYKTRGVLTVVETIQLLELWIDKEIKSRLDLLLMDPESRIPAPYSRLRCSKCNSELPDGIINPKWPFGRYILAKYSNTIVCGFCSRDTE
jgi:hypothetical protein